MQASIPLVKLCAMVSMKKGPGSNIQTFSLPLKLVSEASVRLEYLSMILAVYERVLAVYTVTASTLLL